MPEWFQLVADGRIIGSVPSYRKEAYAMDRLRDLALRLNCVLDELHAEASARSLNDLQAPLAWLDEANGWLNFELQRGRRPRSLDSEPQFVYIPLTPRT